MLTTPQKSVLANGPSFIPTPNDVSWLKELDSSIKQLLNFASKAFGKGKKIELAKIAPDQEQETANPKIPGDPPKTKKNKIGAMYESKPTSNKNPELFRVDLEKHLIIR